MGMTRRDDGYDDGRWATGMIDGRDRSGASCDDRMITMMTVGRDGVSGNDGQV